MKKIGVIVLFIIVIWTTLIISNKKNDNIQSANPATEYCIKQGGIIEKKIIDSTEEGICKLKDGKEIEQWEYFRSSQENK